MCKCTHHNNQPISTRGLASEISIAIAFSWCVALKKYLVHLRCSARMVWTNYQFSSLFWYYCSTNNSIGWCTSSFFCCYWRKKRRRKRIGKVVLKKGWLVENLMTIVNIVPPGVPSLNDDITRLHKQANIAVKAIDGKTWPHPPQCKICKSYESKGLK